MKNVMTAKMKKGTELEDIEKDRHWLIKKIKDESTIIEVKEIQTGDIQSITVKITIC